MQHDGIDEPGRDVTDGRIDERCCDRYRAQDADPPRIDLHELGECHRLDSIRRDRREGDRHHGQQCECALEKQISECKRIVLVQDGEGQRQRRMMTHEFHRPRGIATVELAQVKS